VKWSTGLEVEPTDSHS